MAATPPIPAYALQMRGVLYALAATAIWGGNYIVARIVAGMVPPVTLSVFRWLGAICILLPFVLRPLLRDMPIIRAHLWYYLAISITGISAYTPLIYMAAAETSVLNMTLIATSTPVFTLILARCFFNEPITYKRLLGIAGAFAGIALLAAQGDMLLLLQLQFHKGDLLVLAASLGFAVYNILVRYKPAGTDNNAFLAVTFVIGCAALLPFMAWELLSGASVTLIASSLAAIGYLCIGPSILGYWFWTRAIASIGPANSSFIYYSLPLFSGIAALLLLGEPVLWMHVASGALILSGIILATKT